MGKYDLEEIHERIKETKKWEDSDEKRMSMKALGSMILARGGQIEYKSGIYLEKDQLRIPGFWDRVFGNVWLDYDDANVFDGTRSINLINGKTRSSPLKREYAYMEPIGYATLDLDELLDFIRLINRKVEP